MSNNGVIYKCLSTEILNILNTFIHFLCVCVAQRATCGSQCPSVGSRNGTEVIRCSGTFSFEILFFITEYMMEEGSGTCVWSQGNFVELVFSLFL